MSISSLLANQMWWQEVEQEWHALLQSKGMGPIHIIVQGHIMIMNTFAQQNLGASTRAQLSCPRHPKSATMDKEQLQAIRDTLNKAHVPSKRDNVLGRQSSAGKDLIEVRACILSRPLPVLTEFYSNDLAPHTPVNIRTIATRRGF
ncbi:hypothetical protein VOLCADRAFT_91939 [Volvox carteri f. nagariensis]|uniref:Uncharacterized protein n=1 Tax=Volvox carteri f. nagariensis TaxID=3068 RepID=D8TYC8_VOLCA|nr:uncharacterized protein VOLCADRAFT_91939 [Volvox carteri f. nagariensis]EFJ47530.1 hypothetical protein VOLCADRAFT_91939 [Volvox carteri f. nagariensis]|eukprot:XP_002951354.1 hypothetical protein VOLCADRAFT_91939 [Volvox carteri f. nagariensis]